MRFEAERTAASAACGWPTRLALWAIRAYQRWVSPHKGFACAWRVHTGGSSCSALGYRAIRRYGVIGGLGVLDLRLALCADCAAERAADRGAAWTVGADRRLRPGPWQRQRGSCDAPCDAPCDPGCDSREARCLDSACRNLGCADCADCDWRRRRDDRPTRKEREAARRRIREGRARRAAHRPPRDPSTPDADDIARPR